MHDPSLDEHIEETRNFNQLVAAFMPQLPSWDTAEGLEQLRANDGGFASEPLEGVIERDLPGLTPDVAVHARVTTPDSGRIDAVHLSLHGGGWCIGSAQSEDAHAKELADAANVVVVSIDYRLAPEHPFPAGPDDCEAAALWLIENAATEWGADRLTIGGGSAGCHLAAVTMLRLRDRHGAGAIDRFVAANLLMGPFDLGMTPSQRTAAQSLVIPRSTLDAIYAHFLPGLDEEARRHPDYSPLYADLQGLPPALFTVGTLDPLFDDSLFMAARYEAAGNDTTLHVYPESVHSFTAFPTEMARVARGRVNEWLGKQVASS
jgi:acetyl esterase/lipase